MWIVKFRAYCFVLEEDENIVKYFKWWLPAYLVYQWYSLRYSLSMLALKRVSMIRVKGNTITIYRSHATDLEHRKAIRNERKRSKHNIS